MPWTALRGRDATGDALAAARERFGTVIALAHNSLARNQHSAIALIGATGVLDARPQGLGVEAQRVAGMALGRLMLQSANSR